MASYKIEFTKSALKDLRSIDKSRVPRIFETIERLAEEPRPDGCKKLAGSDFTYRIRIGDYRVIYEIFDSRLLIDIVRVRHRRDAYR
jgi:mRNA interferase RelE/StbE